MKTSNIIKKDSMIFDEDNLEILEQNGQEDKNRYVPEDEEEVETTPIRNRMKIRRKLGNSDTYEEVDIQKAFACEMEREYISRERRKRFISTKYPPGVEDLVKGHDVYRFRNYAIKKRSNYLDIVRIVNIEDQEHNFVESCKQGDKDKYFYARV